MYVAILIVLPACTKWLHILLCSKNYTRSSLLNYVAM